MIANPHPRIPWMDTAYAMKGTEATPGPHDNQKIMDWAKITEVTKDYTGDNIAWCGLFVAFCMAQNGLPIVDTPLWAKSWNNYGTKLTHPQFGCIMIFTRNGGGHVGFYVSNASEDSYYILGGNQSSNHQVTIGEHSKSSLIGMRWPPGMDKFLRE